MKKALMFFVAVSGLLGVHWASAQEQGGSGDDPVLEEIVVTATKTTERSIQDTPIAITVFTEESLMEKGITNFRDMEMFTPGLETAINGPGTTLVMRGMGSQADLFGLGNVAVNFDGVIVEDSGNWLAGFLDVDRVEVLRGPQGTLYGRNSTSGAINLITRNPGDEFEYLGIMSYGNYNDIRIRGTLSGPVSENAGLRFSVEKRNRDGYITNFNPNADDGMDEDTLVANGTFTYDFSDTFRLVLKMDYLDQDYSPNYRPATDTNAGHLLGGTVYEGFWEINTDVDEQVDEQYWGGSLLLEKDFGDGLTFRSLTGYREMDSFFRTDFDTTEVPLGGATFLGDKQTFTQEFQLVGTSDRAEWIIGLYYFDSDLDSDQLIEVGFPDPVLGLISVATDGVSGRTAWAAFGNLNFRMTDRLWLNAGVRYSYEEADSFTSQVLTSSVFGPFPPAQTFGDADWDSVDPKLGLDFYINDDMMLYGYVATGFKAGAFNADGTPYGEEKILTYELGYKSTLLDGRMILNIAAFYNDMEDLQVLVFDPTNLASFSSIQNAAEATVKGIEAELTWAATDALLLTGNLTLTDGTIDKWEDALYYDGSIVDVSGNQIPYAPEASLNLGARYTWGLSGGGDLSVSADYAWVDDVRYDAFEDDDVTQFAYDTLSATIRYEGASRRWSVELYGANLTEEEAFGWMITSPFSQAGFPDVAGSVIAPRTYGVRLSVYN